MVPPLAVFRALVSEGMTAPPRLPMLLTRAMPTATEGRGRYSETRAKNTGGTEAMPSMARHRPSSEMPSCPWARTMIARPQAATSAPLEKCQRRSRRRSELRLSKSTPATAHNCGRVA
ncbi:hypothetical protein D3C76_1264010 [compost metagenome]